MTRIIAVTSGKGGVGKTHLSVNLALQFARRGLRVCVFDADLGLANINLLLKLTPRKTLGDVIAGTARLGDIVIRSEHGIDIIPGSSGIAEMADLPPAALRKLGEQFLMLGDYDLVLFDTSSGIARNVLAFATAAPETLLVVTPEPTALTDAYALIKVLKRSPDRGLLKVVVNQAESERQALHTFEKFREVVRVYQAVDLPFLGWVPVDSQVAEAARQQQPVSVLAPGGAAAVAYRRLAGLLLEDAPAVDCEGLAAFWTRLTGVAPEVGPAAEPEVPAAPIPAPEPAAAAQSVPAVATDLDDRMRRVEVSLEVLLKELQELRQGGTQAARPAMPEPAVEVRKRPAAVERPTVPAMRMRERRIGRRAGEASGPARFVRNAQRATPIDSLQLRRVVGRMLVKAAQGGEDVAQGPLEVAVEHVQIAPDNDYSLRPGRYTQVALHCGSVDSPDAFIEEIFNACAIAGCKVRQLGSNVRYWLTTGQDGCILLDGDGRQSHCVRVYLAAGGNGLLDEMTETPPPAVPSLRRVSEAGRRARATPAILLEKYPHQRLAGRAVDGEPVEIYRLLRRGRAPLVCGFHTAGNDSTTDQARDHFPLPD